MDTKLISGQELGMKILDACKVEHVRVIGVSVDMKPNEAATLTVVRVLTPEEAEDLISAVTEYDLVERKG